MKKALLSLVVLCFLFVDQAFAAEYIVKKGDNLWLIAEHFGHTVEEMVVMNNLKTDNLQVGQRLIYISNDDLKCALMWCFYRKDNLPDCKNCYSFYKSRQDDLEMALIKYRSGQMGVNWRSCLAYAAAWRQKNSGD